MLALHMVTQLEHTIPKWTTDSPGIARRIASISSLNSITHAEMKRLTHTCNHP